VDGSPPRLSSAASQDRSPVAELGTAVSALTGTGTGIDLARVDHGSAGNAPAEDEAEGLPRAADRAA
jgi:hypothetical protein